MPLRPGFSTSSTTAHAEAWGRSGHIQWLRLRYLGEVESASLQQALTSRIVIEQAKGVLAERLKISADDAFEVLRGVARSRNRLLSELARDVASGTADVATLVR